MTSDLRRTGILLIQTTKDGDVGSKVDFDCPDAGPVARASSAAN